MGARPEEETGAGQGHRKFGASLESLVLSLLEPPSHLAQRFTLFIFNLWPFATFKTQLLCWSSLKKTLSNLIFSLARPLRGGDLSLDIKFA